MAKTLLIVGVDPGTTSAYAALDTDGNLVAFDSGKTFDLSILINELILAGKTLVVGCDKKTTPSFVYRYATKVGASLVTPKADLLVAEKKKAVDQFCEKHGVKMHNTHESDALASALFAYKEVRTTIEKVKNAMKKSGDKKYQDRVMELVIQDGLSIQLALEIAKDKEDETTRLIKKVLDKRPSEPEMRITKGEEVTRLYDKIKRQNKLLDAVRKDNNRLKADNQTLLSQKTGLERKLKRAVDTAKGQAERKIGRKNDKTSLLRREIKRKDDQIEQLTRYHEIHRDMLSTAKKSYILKRLATLGYSEYLKKKKLLMVDTNDILYVSDPSIFSRKTIDALKDMVTFIVFSKRPPILVSKSFICIDARKLNIKESEDFAIVDKKSFDSMVDDDRLLDRIVDEYKSSRKQI
ncbi:hypothetical protein COV93_05375 [Candidatus Woesearchaeota archaeon CG11_big_fil_rev_8_21_14_0_20_43_8]|nr:MAG: hypothetical protein COV93_05375 [Candidatus Woesearchaeota archaeon CG11_big_fil_rev_8_21_14_0_20_43_8]PIO05207.1 MAG: hypothetical protein COT47_05840 [Candidatus Woesearchaeota archaeon CG08_land_8_20_14_0_20_43_7]